VRRRDILKLMSAAGFSLFPWRSLSGAVNRGKVLYFTRSAAGEHAVVKHLGAEPGVSGKNMIEMGRIRGFEVECTNDGRVFEGDLSGYDAIAFYTSGDLTRPAPDNLKPVSSAGKQRLLEAIAQGKGFMGFHSAADAFHSRGSRHQNQTDVDPYVAMLGGECLAHGKEQEASLLAGSSFLMKSIGVPGQGLSFTEEWCTFKNFAKDLHVVLVQETRYLKGRAYRRPDYPCTWARKHGQGRVFYTSMGHCPEIWTNPFFQAITQAGLEWVLGRFDADVTPNINQVTPGANQLRS